VYANGQLLGNHPYACTGFSYDLTGIVHTDGVTPNVIAVQAANQIPSSRWYCGSGIFRNVRIIVTDPVRIARHGTFISTPDAAATVTEGYVNVTITTDIPNARQEPAGRTVAGSGGSPVGRLNRRVEPGDHHHVRAGDDHAGPAHDDQRRAEHLRRLPVDRRAGRCLWVAESLGSRVTG
jgi:beta-galactosidase